MIAYYTFQNISILSSVTRHWKEANILLMQMIRVMTINRNGDWDDNNIRCFQASS